MIGLLRNSASIHKGLYGVSASPFPTADLSFLWTGGYDGTSLLNTKGANPTYVSGTGLDAIYDFSVLSDVRFDKSNAAYWGSSLNAYFYYDAGNPYHYKLKDFHYRYFYDQMASDNNFAFATLIYLSGVLQSVDFIAIYSTEQEDSNLSKLKTYIRIIADYYGDENILNGGAEGQTDWVDTDLNGTADGYLVKRGVGSIVTGNGFTGNAQRFVIDAGETNAYLKFLSFSYEQQTLYRIKFKYRTNGYLQIVGGFSIPNIPANTGDALEFEYIGSGVSTNPAELIIYCYGTAGTWAEIDELSMERAYVDTYNGEFFFLNNVQSVITMALFGDSIMKSGFGSAVDKTTGAYTPDYGYEHLSKLIVDEVLDSSILLDTPIRRNIEHSDWNKTGSEVYSKYPDATGNSKNAICLIQDAEYAELLNITAKEKIVLFFEGGVKDQDSETGIAKIEVSKDGAAYQTPSSLGLLGKFTNSSYETVKDTFDTAIEYPATAYNPYYTSQLGYAPYLQLEYCGLDESSTYKFKITRSSGNSIRLFGAMYFTGTTFITINPAIPGMDWDILRRVIYNTMYKSNADICLMESPIFHDAVPESEIIEEITDLIGDFQKWNVPLVLMSCSPGGFVTRGSDINILGDELPTKLQNTNFVKEFNHRLAFTITKPAYADYPENGDIYSITYNEETYNLVSILDKPSSGNYDSWTYNDQLYLLTDDSTIYDALYNNEIGFPITITKVSGSGAASFSLTAREYTPPSFERHRDMVQELALSNSAGFIDVYDEFKQEAIDNSETLETEGYEMLHTHSFWSNLDKLFRRYELVLPNTETLPTIGDTYQITIDSVVRNVIVYLTGTVDASNNYVKFQIEDSDYYLNDVTDINDWVGTYTKVLGDGDATMNSFTSMRNFYPAIYPIKMNYMSNYFYEGDGHHLIYAAHDLYLAKIKEEFLYKIP